MVYRTPHDLVFLPHFLPVPAVFSCGLPHLFFCFLNTRSLFLHRALACDILSAWGILPQLAVWLPSSVHLVTSPETQSLLPHQILMLTSLSLPVPLSCFIFLCCLYDWHSIYLLVYHSSISNKIELHERRYSFSFDVSKHLGQCLIHTSCSINIK